MIAENAYQRIFDRMNNEINRLWQRSIFLGTFLVLIFVAYGNVLLRLFSLEGCCRKTEFLYDSPLNIVCVGISIFGIMFSVLWVMMGKGSKAWQEKYERTIYELESNGNNWNEALRRLAKYGVTHGRLRGIPPCEFSNCILNSKSGAYSPSKINIAIGQISLVFWLLCSFFHLVSYCCANDFCRILNSGKTYGVIAPTVVFVCLYANIIKECNSSVIQGKQDQEAKRKKSKSHENK